jgi:hypothetical protein
MTAAIEVNDLTFGVELVVTLPAGTCPVGGYHAGVQVPQLPQGWRAERDSSIQAGPGYTAAEIVINNHPHPADGGRIVHNGQVRDYRGLVEAFGLHPVSTCDI